MPNKTQIGAQMYTIREYCKTPGDIAQSCQRLRQIGYEAVQVSALGPIPTKELAKVLDGEGLACAATHVSLDMMRDVNLCVEYHEELKCKYPAIGGFWPKENVTSAAVYEAFARDFSAIAAPLAAKGLRLGYHNHSRELARLDDGRRLMDLLLSKCSADVWFEIDTYWLAHGGGDPAAWIDQVAASGAKRLPCTHFKDLAVTIEQEQKMAEVGAGNLNWPRILASCRAAGVEWYLVERDNGELDPFDSLRISLENMKAMGLK